MPALAPAVMFAILVSLVERSELTDVSPATESESNVIALPEILRRLIIATLLIITRGKATVAAGLNRIFGVSLPPLPLMVSPLDRV